MSTLFITRPDLPASQELLTARRQGGRLVGTLKRGHSTICTFVISPSQERCIARGERIAIRDTDVISIARGTRVLEAEQLSHSPERDVIPHSGGAYYITNAEFRKLYKRHVSEGVTSISNVRMPDGSKANLLMHHTSRGRRWAVHSSSSHSPSSNLALDREIEARRARGSR